VQEFLSSIFSKSCDGVREMASILRWFQELRHRRPILFKYSFFVELISKLKLKLFCEAACIIAESNYCVNFFFYRKRVHILFHPVAILKGSEKCFPNRRPLVDVVVTLPTSSNMVMNVMKGSVQEGSKVPVNSGQGPTDKVPFFRGVVGQEEVRVVELTATNHR